MMHPTPLSPCVSSCVGLTLKGPGWIGTRIVLEDKTLCNQTYSTLSKHSWAECDEQLETACQVPVLLAAGGSGTGQRVLGYFKKADFAGGGKDLEMQGS